MIVATWNINGIKARSDGLVAWLNERRPDIACLQEIKSVDETFPRKAIEDAGYHVETHGQKGFNGVAILSRTPPDSVEQRLPGDDADEHARWIEATWPTESGATLRVVSLYLPNGNPLDSPKFPYKRAWMDRMIDQAAARLESEDVVVLAGDYNVIPTDADAAKPEAWRGDALAQPETRAAFRRLLNLGFTDALRAASDADDLYTFWDYQAGAWQKNNGIRIDHCLLSPEAADRLGSVEIDRHVRSWEKPSDHVPVVIELAL